VLPAPSATAMATRLINLISPPGVVAILRRSFPEL